MDETALREWCDNVAKNGIAQHSDEWLRAKTLTIGGSSIAIIDGTNSFTNLHQYIALKLGLAKFESDVKPQWGNLFEEVIKLEVEQTYNCNVYGEDLYVVGKHYGTAYSPDGLAIIDGKVVLLEFKCPYSRIPGKLPPAYYVPQVKMGLCMLEPPQEGLYIEAVYRRCSWADLGPGLGFDKILVPRPATGRPVSYGFIGFYTTAEKYAEIVSRAGDDGDAGGTVTIVDGEYVHTPYAYERTCGVPGYSQEYREFNAMNDLGISSPTLFKTLMALFDKGLITPWYGRVLKHQTGANAEINSDLQRYREFCSGAAGAAGAAGGIINFGILPWKLLRIESHKIDREEDFLDRYIEPIKTIVDFVKSTCEKTDAEKQEALTEFIKSYYNYNPDNTLEEYEE